MRIFSCKLLLVSLMALPALAQQTKSAVSKTTNIYNEEGQLQMSIYYNPSCSCKTYTEYYWDGKVYAKRTFQVTATGEYVHGDDLTYYHDGSVKIYKLWKEANPDGRAYFNYEDGRLEHEEFFEGKYKSGTWKYFDAKGVLLKEQIFARNKTHWNSKKDFVTNKYYFNNKLAYSEVLESGKTLQLMINDTAAFKRLAGKNPIGKSSILPDTLTGKALFTIKCVACHPDGKDGFGPSLKGVTNQRSGQWLASWIRDGMKLVLDKDPQAMAIYSKWNKSHPKFDRLSARQVQLLIDYLKKNK